MSISFSIESRMSESLYKNLCNLIIEMINENSKDCCSGFFNDVYLSNDTPFDEKIGGDIKVFKGSAVSTKEFQGKAYRNIRVVFGSKERIHIWEDMLENDLLIIIRPMKEKDLMDENHARADYCIHTHKKTNPRKDYCLDGKAIQNCLDFVLEWLEVQE